MFLSNILKNNLFLYNDKIHNLIGINVKYISYIKCRDYEFLMNSKSITCYSYSTKNLVVFNVSRNLELQNI